MRIESEKYDTLIPTFSHHGRRRSRRGEGERGEGKNKKSSKVS